MNKTGIVTLHQANNYGAVLQAYSLQKVLEDMGQNAELISFSDLNLDAKTPNIIANITRSPWYIKYKRAQEFDKFRKTYLRTSSLIDVNKIEKLNKLYSKFIVGSDQVWNWDLTEVDKRFLLYFAEPNKRYSYAASLGGYTPSKELKGTFSKYLSQFRKISVRDRNSKETLSSFGIESDVVLDPTLLVNMTSINEVADASTKSLPENYGFLYLMQDNQKLIDAAKEKAKLARCKLIILTAGLIRRKPYLYNSIVSVNTWLSMIRDAQFVVTNSYHGLIFASRYKKPTLFSTLNEQLAQRNVRFYDLLKFCNIRRSRYGILSIHGFVDEELSQKQTISMNYLKSIFND